MSEASDAAPLIAAKQLRDSAHALVREDIALLREGLAERPVGTRIRDRAADEIAGAVDTVREVAAENKAVVAGTVLALAAWFLRGPIARGIETAVERFRDMIDR